MSPLFVLFASVVVFFITGLTMKYVSDGQKELDEGISLQNDLVSKSNVDIIKKDAVKRKQGEEVKGTADWQAYRNEILGIDFLYPKEWGYPTIDPNNHITDLRLFAAGSTQDQDNLYYGSLTITFLKNPDIEIRMYDDRQPGENYANYGWTDFTRLKATQNICDYTISIDSSRFVGKSLKEIYSECRGAIKHYITRETEYFSPDQYFGSEKGEGYLYSYDLVQAAFLKTRNGYYDNVLIKYTPNSFSQIKEAGIGIDDFFNKDFHQEKQEKQISKDLYLNKSQDFVNFVNSFQSIALQKKVSEPFTITPGEEQNITLIRRYYYALDQGDLNGAYALLGKAPKRPEFDSSYAKVYKSEPRDFKRLKDGSYQFLLDFQIQNGEPELYRDTFTVIDGKINPVSSEKITSPFVYSEDIYAFAKEADKKNYVIVFDGGKEIVAEQAQADSMSDKPTGNTFFRNVRLSPKSSYLLYDRLGWEYFDVALYDIKNKKPVKLDMPYAKAEFTPDEKYFFTCGASDFGGTFVGEVYSVPDFKSLNVLAGVKENYHQIDCSYDAGNNKIMFRMSVVWDDTKGNFDNNKQETVIFDTQNGKIREIKS